MLHDVKIDRSEPSIPDMHTLVYAILRLILLHLFTDLFCKDVSLLFRIN